MIRVSARTPGALPLGLVVNSQARGVRRRYLQRYPFWRTLVPADLVRVTSTLGQLDEAIAAFAEAGVGTVAVLGGDGSVHHLVDAILRCHEGRETPIVLALAAGTMNGVPRALGTGGPPDRVLRAALTALAGGAPAVEARHVLRVADARDGRACHGFGFATGLVYRAFRHYYRNPEPGVLDAVSASLLPLTAALFGGRFYDGVALDVRVDGAPWLPELPHTLVASVLDQPLLWFKPFGPTLGGDAVFHLAATSMRPREIAPRLWAIFRGRCRHPRLRVGSVQEATVRAAGDIGYVIDGDLHPAGVLDVRLTLGPRLRFLVPGGVDRRGPGSAR